MSAQKKSETAKRRVAVVDAETPRSLAWARAGLWLAAAALVVFLPEGMIRWFLPKEALFAVAVLAASVTMASGRLPRWLLIGIGGVVLLLLVGVAFSASPWAALWGRWPRYEGLVSLPVYIAAAFFGARLLGPGSSVNRVNSWWSAISTASIALGVVGVLESFGLDPIPTNLERPGALLGNATDQGIIGAAFFAMLLAPAVERWRAPLPGRRPWLLTVGALAGFVSVVASASRAAFVAVVIAVIVLAAFAIMRERRRRRAAGARAPLRERIRIPLIAVAGTVGLVGIALAVPLTRDRLLGLSPLSSRTVADRQEMWGETLQLLGGSPLTGAGPSGFVDAIPRFHSAAWYDVVGSQTVLDSPHNMLLQAAVAGGVLLPLVLLVVGVLVIVFGVRAWNRVSGSSSPHGPLLAGSAAALLAIAGALLTTFTVAATGILACLLVGILVAVPAKPVVETGRPVGLVSGRRRALQGAIALWAVLLVVAAAAEIPLQRGIVAARAGGIADAQGSFELAQALRPWDADVASIAAQTLAAQALEGRVEAGELAERWAEEALRRVPDSIAALRALAAAQDAAGDIDAELATLDRIIELSPNDPEAIALRAEVAARR
ncbi:O-antigen ligase family protein [Herbiconiux liukaitaii]|uniref:O-antigen ligase family protein n=1 Tax=Herbiconiux liukaitaii TaxID=3342799 RepID=UPI0035B6BA0B